MHIYIAARGVVPRLDAWENDLLSKFYPVEVEKGKTVGVQLAMRQIRFYEVAFAEPQLDNALTALQPRTCWNPSYQKYLWMLQKAMGLEKIPRIPKPPNNMWDPNFMNHQWVECAGIGIKKDRYENGIEQV